MSQVQLAAGHAREYETIYILRPNIDKEKADDVANRVSEAIKENHGKVVEAELWGSRRLAYPIKRHHRGTYVYVKYLSRGEAVAEIERQLRLVDSVIRYQTVVLRSQIPVEGIEGSDELSLDFDMPFEPDEPELSIERQLGLDAPFADRRRGRDRDDRDRDRDRDQGEAKAKSEGDEAKAEAAEKTESAEAAEKPAEKAEEAKTDEGGES